MQAVARNCRNQSLRWQGKRRKRLKPRGKSTEAEHWGGPRSLALPPLRLIITTTPVRCSGAITIKVLVPHSLPPWLIVPGETSSTAQPSP